MACHSEVNLVVTSLSGATSVEAIEANVEAIRVVLYFVGVESAYESLVGQDSIEAMHTPLSRSIWYSPRGIRTDQVAGHEALMGQAQSSVSFVSLISGVQ